MILLKNASVAPLSEIRYNIFVSRQDIRKGQTIFGIGKQIKHYRLRKSVRQEDLADYLGVSCQAISKWETEASMPDITLLPRLAVYFGIAIDDLFRVSVDEQLERIENALLNHRAYSDHQSAIWQVYCNRADRFKKLGRYEEALADYEHCFVMQQPPRLSDGLYSKAQVYEQLERYWEAIFEHERIIACLQEDFGLTDENEGIREQRREIERLSKKFV